MAERGPAGSSERVAAVVVNYNAGGLLRRCVHSLQAAGVHQLVVADNASTDDSLAGLAADDPTVTVVETGANLGYGAGANRGVTATDSPYVLVCNPDLEVDEGAVGALAAALDADPALGVVGPRIDAPDGTLYPSARPFPRLGDAIGHAFVGLVRRDNPWTRRYLLDDWDHASSRTVDWVSGACFLARRRAWDDVGGFDEGYFMFMEDVDLCWRLGRAAWGVGYEPGARVTHVEGVSRAQVPYRMVVAHHRSLWRWARARARGPSRALLPAVAVALVVRAAALCGLWATRNRRARAAR